MGSNVLSNTSGGQPPQHMHSSSAPSLVSTSISGHTNGHNGQQMDSTSNTSTTTAITSMNPMGGQGGVPAMNIAYLCRVGDETVHEIVSKTGELFQSLRAMSPSVANTHERQLRAKEVMKSIEFLFRRLRKMYDKCSECMSGLDFIQIETIIPMKDSIQDSHRLSDSDKKSVAVKQLDREANELTDLLLLKNRQIKEVIDNLRAIVWEINAMLAMRKP